MFVFQRKGRGAAFNSVRFKKKIQASNHGGMHRKKFTLRSGGTHLL